MTAPGTSKHILVTGGSSGIGRETALGLAKLGAAVTIVGRDPGRTREAVAWIKTGSGNQAVDSLRGDFSTLAEVRRVAAEYRATHSRLDVLVNNAGAGFGTYGETADGYEQNWAVNHLSYFLLTHELLDLLRAAPSARIVNVASDLHTCGRIDFPADEARHYGPVKSYSRSKLANVLFSHALARRLKGAGITVNCLHPGAVKTDIAHDMRGPLKAINWALQVIFSIPPEKGALTSIHLASSPEVAGITGRYFKKCRAAKSSALSRDEALQESVWKLSAAQCGLPLE
ncbi:MAG: short-chain dehydrogenase/reductase [Akkermansiaceae bacterium]|nr:short-chain dehydrogenase/reductase [Akkermansiaceae bacterium]